MALFMTVKEMAQLKGCTLKYVYDLLAAGRLRGAEKTGRVWRIPADALETGAARRRTPAVNS